MTLALVSVAEQAILSLTLSETPKTGFLMMRLNYDPYIQGLHCLPFHLHLLDALHYSSNFRLIQQFFHMSHVARKPVFKVSDQVRLKPACSTSEASWSLEILDLESIDIILSRQLTKKALIKLCSYAG